MSGCNFQLVSIKFPLVFGSESQLKDSYVPPEYPIGLTCLPSLVCIYLIDIICFPLILQGKGSDLRDRGGKK